MYKTPRPNENVIHIRFTGSYSFNGTGFTSLTLPACVTSVSGAWVFGNCTSLATLTMEDGVTVIGNSAFRSCTSLANLSLPDTLNTIEQYAFYGCTSLTSVTIPDGLTSIGNNSFQNCTAMTSLTIGEGVTYLGDEAFMNCTSMTTIHYNAKNVGYVGSERGSSHHSTYNRSFSGVGTAGDGVTVTFGENVEKIPAYLFNVTNIGEPYSVSKVTSVVINAKNCFVDAYAFYNVSALTSLTFGETVEDVRFTGNYSFYQTGITSLTLPACVTDMSGAYVFANCANLAELAIEEGLTSIPSYAFQNCTSLASVTIPDSVTSIGNNSFQNCTGLMSLTIGEGVTYLGDEAFMNCTSMTTIHYMQTCHF